MDASRPMSPSELPWPELRTPWKPGPLLLPANPLCLTWDFRPTSSRARTVRSGRCQGRCVVHDRLRKQRQRSQPRWGVQAGLVQGKPDFDSTRFTPLTSIVRPSQFIVLGDAGRANGTVRGGMYPQPWRLTTPVHRPSRDASVATRASPISHTQTDTPSMQPQTAPGVPMTTTTGDVARSPPRFSNGAFPNSMQPNHWSLRHILVAAVVPSRFRGSRPTRDLELFECVQ